MVEEIIYEGVGGQQIQYISFLSSDLQFLMFYNTFEYMLKLGFCLKTFWSHVT